MANISETMLYEGLSVDIAFGDPRPHFGDLFQICGDTHPRFPPTRPFGFDKLADLQFSQVDDYFGVHSLADDGDDVVVWLFPLVGGEPVFHHEGPFDGIRLDYNVLRNPRRHAEFYLKCVQAFASLGNGVLYRSRELELVLPDDLAALRADIEAIIQHWAAQSITVGSDDALQVDY